MATTDIQNRPLISVVVPCFNSEGTVGEALCSLERQTYGRWEAIVIDDASTDSSASVIQRYVSRDPRFRLVRNDVNRGLSATRNRGVEAAQSEYLCFLDADDRLYGDALASMVTMAGKRQGSDGVYSSFDLVHPGGEQFRINAAEEASVTFPSLCRRNIFQVPAMLIRKSLLQKAGMFDESFRQCEDWDLWLRVYRIGGRLSRISESLAAYSVNYSGLSRQFVAQWEAGCRVIEIAHRVDDRCEALPQYVDGPGTDSKATAHETWAADCLGNALLSGDGSAACELLSILLSQGMVAPTAGTMAGVVMAKRPSFPGGRQMTRHRWAELAQLLKPFMVAASRSVDRGYRRRMTLRIADEARKMYGTKAAGALLWSSLAGSKKTMRREEGE